MTHGPGEVSEKGSGNYQMFQLLLWHFTKLKIHLIYSLHFLQNILPETLILSLSEGFHMLTQYENNIGYSICFQLKQYLNSEYIYSAYSLRIEKTY